MKVELFFVIALLYSACSGSNHESMNIVEANLSDTLNNTTHPNKLDKDYWYSGKAEVTKYSLKQNRYKEVHDGEIILIFVTEDFLTDKQVKNDNYVNKNSTSVLKTNQLRRFTTGLYDYSMMTSVFTRADGSATEKITLTSQDWCGQSFIQLNRVGNKYHAQLRSYFESEGDQNIEFSADLLEDEIFNKIRINPDALIKQELEILPSLVYLRLAHQPIKTYKANISKRSKKLNGKNVIELEIKYLDIDRVVTITYENSSPFKIISFIESYPSVIDKVPRQSVATKVSEIYDAYWKMNSKKDATKREELGVTGF